MTEARAPLSKISHTDPDSITVRGLDLTTELLGRVNLGDIAFLELTGRLPSEPESTVFNAMLVALVEHGLTPSTIAARLTYLGAPEALQGAVAAGVLGLGNVFVGSVEGAARMLQEQLPASDDLLDEAAAGIVREHRKARSPIPGIGHPVHKPQDPRTVRLFELATENSLAGRYVSFMEAVGRQVEQQSGKMLPINVTGAIGALVSELGMPWQIARGIGVMSRPIGIVAHLLEEQESPIADGIWQRADRNEL